MADVKTIQKLKELVGEIEGLEPKGDCEAYVRGLLLEQLYKADEFLEILAADSAELPPLKLKPTAGSPPNERTRKDKKKGSE